MNLFQHSSNQDQGSVFKQLPLSVKRHSSDAPCTWEFESKEVRAACISCFSQPCRKFDDSDISAPPELGMVRDLDSDVCPVGAITWCSDTNTPKIDQDRCIGCGLCVARCPVGALYLSQGTSTHDSPDEFTESQLTVVDKTEQAAQTLQIERLPKVQYLDPIDDDLAAVSVTLKLLHINDQSRVVARLSRNLLVALGSRAALGREGNVHHRMDGFFTLREGAGGPLEIEAGQDSLEALRAVLDSLSVLHSQFSRPLSELLPLIIYVSLPTERQEYWLVSRDIHRVLGVQIPSITIGALLLLLWNGTDLTLDTLNQIAKTLGAKTIRQVIANVLEREIDIPLKELGIPEPQR